MNTLSKTLLLGSCALGLAALPWVLPASAQEAPPSGQQPGPNEGSSKQPDGQGGHHHEPVKNHEEAKRRFNPQNDPDITITDNGDGTYGFSHVFRR